MEAGEVVANIIDEALGVIDPVEKELSIASSKTVVPRPSDNLEDLDADYKYQRENFYNLIVFHILVQINLGNVVFGKTNTQIVAILAIQVIFS